MSPARSLSKAPVQKRLSPGSKTRAKDRAFSSGTKLSAILCVLLAGATIALYSPVGEARFLVWDDHEYVTGNPHIQRFGWSNIEWAFTSTTYAANWHPLTWLSHALDYQLFALSPAGHHWVNVLLHAVNVVVLFLVLARITRRFGPSALVAALFAVHPLNVESVAWVAERKNLLSTLFFLLAIGAYARYVEKPDRPRYLAVAVLFVAGLMAKPMVVTLPFVLLLLDYWPLGRVPGSPASAIEAPQLPWSKLALEKIPLLALSAISAAITLKAQRGAVRSFAEYSFGVRLENAIVSYALYLWKMIWPARLAALYPHPPGLLPVWQVLVAGLVLVGITALVIIFRRLAYLPVGWFWFLGTLVPVVGLVQVGEAAMADRYAYITLLGVFIMIAWSFDDWADTAEVRTIWRVVPSLCIVIALGAVTFRQIDDWQSEYAVWTHALDVTDQNPGAQARLASALIHPELTMTKAEMGDFNSRQQLLELARQHYEEALRIDNELAKQNPEAYLAPLAMILNDFGVFHQNQGRSNDERQHYEEALKYFRQLAQHNPAMYKPHLGLVLFNLGNLSLREKRSEEARRYYEEALNIQTQLADASPQVPRPDLASTLVNLGNLDQLENRLDDAHDRCEQALKIQSQLTKENPDLYQPDRATTLFNLGVIEQQQKRPDQARQHLEQALEAYRELAKNNRDRYRQDMIDTVTQLDALEKSSQHQDQTDSRSANR